MAPRAHARAVACPLFLTLLVALARSQSLPPEHNDPSWIAQRPAPSCTQDATKPWCSRVRSPRASAERAAGGCGAAGPIRGAYNTSHARVPGGRVLNVHVVPHTHDDVGWLKTVDEYYTGANQSIQVAGVQYILDTAIAALRADARRTFMYVETAFFARWWDEQPEGARDAVRELVARGQLTFANGGWCMSDEAAPYYVDMVEQQTAGLRFLARELGVVPRVGWQVDPFGHSAFMGTAYALMGMRAYGFGRIDYQDRAKREALRTLELVSHGSPSLGPQSAVLAAVMRGYGPPPGFNWEWFSGADEPVQDDPTLQGYNVRERVDDFVAAALEQAEHYTHCEDGECDIMFTMGSDFHYGNAHVWFKQLDKLLHHVAADGRVNAFYSSAQAYFGAKADSAHAWTTKADDWFPYCDGTAEYDAPTGRVLDRGGHAFWTGYFSSRPALKRYVRRASALLQACRHLELLVPRAADAADAADADAPSSVRLWLALSVAQHHDAVSGTAKQHVTDDYARRLAAGAAECNALISEALRALVGAEQPDAPRRAHADLAFAECALNETACERTTALPRTRRTVRVVAHNALAQPRSEYARVPVPAGSTVRVRERAAPGSAEPHGPWRDVDVLPAPSALAAERGAGAGAGDGSAAPAVELATLHVREVPPLGLRELELEISPAGPGAPRAAPPAHDAPAAPPLLIESASAAVHFEKTGAGRVRVSRLVSKTHGVSAAFDAWVGYYPAATDAPGGCADGDARCRRGQASGAYIFRPNCTEGPAPPCAPVRLSPEGARAVFVRARGACEEAHLAFGGEAAEGGAWATLVLRVCDGDAALGVHWDVGPIPIADGVGKEVVVRFDTDLESARAVATDSNGRDMLRRTRDARPTWALNMTDPVSSNYYPVTALIALEDARPPRRASPRRHLAVHVDRAQGGGSLADGSVELMVHRRLLVDDNRGVAEALNETQCGCTRCACAGLRVVGEHVLELARARGGAAPDAAPAMVGARLRQARAQSPLELRFARPVPVAPERAEGGAGAPAPLGRDAPLPPPPRAALSALAAPLPPQLQLLTLQDLARADVPLPTGSAARARPAPAQLLLRIAHSLAAEEGGSSVGLELRELLRGLVVHDVQETLLGANAPAEHARATSTAPFRTAEPLPAAPVAPVRGKLNDTRVVIAPMEIRTWLVKYSRRSQPHHYW